MIDNCETCEHNRFLAEESMKTLRAIQGKYGLGERHIMREREKELQEAWHLLSVLAINILDDGPTWPRVLEWLKRNGEYKPKNHLQTSKDVL